MTQTTATRINLVDVKPSDVLIIRHDGELIKAFACGRAEYQWGTRWDRRVWTLTVRIDAWTSLTLIQHDENSRYGWKSPDAEVYPWSERYELEVQDGETVLDLSR
jgi:hypothetical protein